MGSRRFACWWQGLLRCCLKLPHASGIVISMLIIGVGFQLLITFQAVI